MSPPNFFSLPRELRDKIYAYHYQSQTVSERTIRPYDPLETDNHPLFLINQIDQPICWTNKFVAAEYLGHVLETGDVRLVGALPEIKSFLQRLNFTSLPRLKSIEIDFDTIDWRVYNNPRGTENVHVVPFYRFVVLATEIRAMAVPLLFSGALRLYWKLGPEPPCAAPNYSITLAAHAIGLLVNGQLEQLTLVLRAKDPHALIDPLVDIQKLANAHWSTWDMASIKPLSDLEDEYNSNANRRITLFDFIVETEMRPDPESEVADVLRIVLWRPQYNQGASEGN